jgi:hypothetical protein
VKFLSFSEVSMWLFCSKLKRLEMTYPIISFLLLLFSEANPYTVCEANEDSSFPTVNTISPSVIQVSVPNLCSCVAKLIHAIKAECSLPVSVASLRPLLDLLMGQNA